MITLAAGGSEGTAGRDAVAGEASVVGEDSVAGPVGVSDASMAGASVVTGLLGAGAGRATS
jgi:hypothetical protein